MQAWTPRDWANIPIGLKKGEMKMKTFDIELFDYLKELRVKSNWGSETIHNIYESLKKLNEKYSDISLRNHYAGLAMQGMLGKSWDGHSVDIEGVKQAAFMIADAMIEASKETK